jgi:hypothetical protein
VRLARPVAWLFLLVQGTVGLGGRRAKARFQELLSFDYFPELSGYAVYVDPVFEGLTF